MGPASRQEPSIYHPFPYVSYRVRIKTALLPIILTTSSEETHKRKPSFYKQVTENSFLRWPPCFRL